MGSGDRVPCILNLGPRWTWVAASRFRSFIKKRSVPTELEVSWLQEQSGFGWWGETTARLCSHGGDCLPECAAVLPGRCPFTFRGNVLPPFRGKKMEAGSSTETSVNTYQTTLRHNLKDILLPPPEIDPDSPAIQSPPHSLQEFWASGCRPLLYCIRGKSLAAWFVCVLVFLVCSRSTVNELKYWELEDNYFNRTKNWNRPTLKTRLGCDYRIQNKTSDKNYPEEVI
jgi:hypothetical protein